MGTYAIVLLFNFPSIKLRPDKYNNLMKFIANVGCRKASSEGVTGSSFFVLGSFGGVRAGVLECKRLPYIFLEI